MKKIYALLITLTLFVSQTAWGAFENENINGNYLCQRYDSNTNIIYQSSLSIQKMQVTYDLIRTNTDGTKSIGTGLFNQNDAGVLAVVLSGVTQPSEKRLQIYRINPDGSLTSTWLLLNENQTGSEACKKQ